METELETKALRWWGRVKTEARRTWRLILSRRRLLFWAALSVPAVWFMTGSLPYGFMPLLLVIAGYEEWWRHHRVRAVAVDGRSKESLRDMLAAWWLQQTRLADLKYWHPKGCYWHGIRPMTGGEKPGAKVDPKIKEAVLRRITPRLIHPKFDLDDDVTAVVAPGRVGSSVSAYEAKTEELAETIGCRDIIVRRTDANGVATVKFLYSDPLLTKEVPIRDLPMPEKGQLAYGVRRDGLATITIKAGPFLDAGVTRSGKSSDIWALFADINRQGIWCDVYISSPKGGQEMRKAAQFEGRRMQHWMVARYAKNPEQTVAMVASLLGVMRARQETIGLREIKEFTQEMPLILVVLDDILTTLPALSVAKRGEQTPLLMLMTEGTAVGILTIAAAQITQQTTIGDIRNGFTQRASHKLMSASSVNTILGDGALQRGARPHLLHPIKHRGVGWSADDEGNVDMFRGALVSEDDIDRIVRGLAPEGMTRLTLAQQRRCAVYRAYSKDKVGEDGEVVPYNRLEYVGKALNPTGRYEGHADDRPGNLKFCPEHGQVENWWTVHVDLAKMQEEWCPTERDALRMEERAVKAERPYWNRVHNRGNPASAWMRGLRARLVEEEPMPWPSFEEPVEGPVLVGAHTGPEFLPYPGTKLEPYRGHPHVDGVWSE